MRLPAMRVSQNGRTLYLSSMSAAQLISCGFTDEWNPDFGWDLDTQGYQRAPKEDHTQRIAKFLANTPNVFMPNGALLSARESQGKLKFTPSAASPTFGELEIPEGRILWIVDYQHRWRGLQKAINDLGASALADFVIPVTIIADIPRPEEIYQFYVINSKQKKVDSDLGLALIQTLAQSLADTAGQGASEDELANLVGPGKRFRIRATRLTFRLAALESGPWLHKIRQPHDLPQGKATISVTSFVDSLHAVVSTRNACSRLSDEELLDILSDFWGALEAMVPKSFADPTSQIQRTVGVYTWHIVFAKGAFPRCEALGKFTKAAFRDVLAPSARKYLGEKFWATRGEARVFVGSSGYRELADRIMKSM